MSADCAAASASTRVLTACEVHVVPRRRRRPPHGRAGRPGCRARRRVSAMVIHSAVAMRVLDGTTSVSTAAPPSPWRSTTVTSAPSRRATSAAS